MATARRTAVWQYRYDELNDSVGTTWPDGRTVEWHTYGSGHVHALVLNVVDVERDDLHRAAAPPAGLENVAAANDKQACAAMFRRIRQIISALGRLNKRRLPFFASSLEGTAPVPSSHLD